MKTKFNTESMGNACYALFLAFILVSATSFGQTYCTPTGTSCSAGKSIYAGDLSVFNYRPLGQEGGLPTTYPQITGCPSNGFTDYKNVNVPTPTFPGSQLLVIGELNYSNNLAPSDLISQALWMDLNNDGVMNSTNEFIQSGSILASNGSSALPPFVMPSTGITFGLINCRLRTTLNQTQTSGNACTSFPGISHTLDFKINIVPGCFQLSSGRYCYFFNGCTYKSNYFNSVSFTTTLGTTIKTSTFDPAGFSDYRSLAISAPFGSTITVSGNIFRENPYPQESYNWLTIWADWNNDGAYDANAGELVGFNNLPNNSNGNIPFSYPVTIPATVTSPKVNFRLMTNYSGIVNGCLFAGGIPFIGETEDYVVNVAAGGVLNGGLENLCSPGNPSNITFSTLPGGNYYYYWYYRSGLVAQPTGTTMPASPWVAIQNNHPITGLPTMTSYDPPAGLTSNRTYACFVAAKIQGQPNPGWALGVKQAKVKTCSGRMTTYHSDSEFEDIREASVCQNIPNPFTTETSIPCFIPEGTQSASLEIFGLDGRKVQQIKLSTTGEQNVKIESRMLPASGMYLYTLVLDGQKQPMQRMVLAK
ncbi:MAG TPA: T9SS type A sorting domain-containing protein [Catalimonadaceae bacterium]|nr:T9SS type A sorting domain-containing protein [Catalimonadaceae bacterium]